MNIVYVENGVSQVIESGLDFRSAATKIRELAPQYLGDGYDSWGNGFKSKDGTKELRLED